MLITSSLIWFKTQSMLALTLESYQNLLSAHGWQLASFEKKKAGWPFSAQLILTPVNLTGQWMNLSGPVSWKSKQVILKVSPLHPLTLTIEINGAQALSLYTQPEQSPYSFLRFWANKFTISFPFSQPFSTAQLSATQLQLAIPGAGPDNIVLIPQLDGRIKWNAQATLTSVLLAMHLDAPEVRLPGQNPWPFDRRLSDTHLSFALTGPSPDLTTGNKGFKDWQNAGGRLLIQQAQAMWGPLAITLSGTLGHNHLQQTKGNFLLTLTHLDTVLDQLQNVKALTDNQHKVIKAVTSLLGHSSTLAAWHQKHMISVPIDLTENGFYLGSLPLNGVFSWLQHYSDYSVTNHLVIKNNQK